MDEAYYKALETVQKRPRADKGLKIVYTLLHGTGNVPVRTMFNRSGYDVKVVGEQCIPDPDFSKTKSPTLKIKRRLKKLLNWHGI